MDFHNAKRKELQKLCKQHGLPAGVANREMVDSLSSFFKEKEKEKMKDKVKEKPQTRGRSCLKTAGENESEKSSKDGAEQVKKVRFSPENQMFEFADLDKALDDENTGKVMTRAARRRSVYVSAETSNKDEPPNENLPDDSAGGLVVVTRRQLRNKEITVEARVVKDLTQNDAKKSRSGAEVKGLDSGSSKESDRSENENVPRRSKRSRETTTDSTLPSEQPEKGVEPRRNAKRRKTAEKNTSMEDSGEAARDADSHKEIKTEAELEPPKKLSTETVAAGDGKASRDVALEEEGKRKAQKNSKVSKQIENPPSKISKVSKQIEEQPSPKDSKVSKKTDKSPPKGSKVSKQIEKPPSKNSKTLKQIEEATSKDSKASQIEKSPPKESKVSKQIEKPPPKNSKASKQTGESPLEDAKSSKQSEKPPSKNSKISKKIEEPPPAGSKVSKQIEKLPLKKIEKPPPKDSKALKQIEKPSPTKEPLRKTRRTRGESAGGNEQLMQQKMETTMEKETDLSDVNSRMLRKRSSKPVPKGTIKSMENSEQKSSKKIAAVPARLKGKAVKAVKAVNLKKGKGVKRKRQQSRSEAPSAEVEAPTSEINSGVEEDTVTDAKLSTSEAAGSSKSPVLSNIKEAQQDTSERNDGSRSMSDANELPDSVKLQPPASKSESGDGLNDVALASEAADLVSGSVDLESPIPASGSFVDAEMAGVSLGPDGGEVSIDHVVAESENVQALNSTFPGGESIQADLVPESETIPVDVAEPEPEEAVKSENAQALHSTCPGESIQADFAPESETIHVDVAEPESEEAVKSENAQALHSTSPGESIQADLAPESETIPVDVAETEPEEAVKSDIPVNSESNESGGFKEVTGSGTKEAKEVTSSMAEGEAIPVDVVETEGAVKPDIPVDSESNGSGGSIKVTGSDTNEATASIPDGGTIPVDVAEPEGAVKPDISVDSESNESGGSMKVTGSGTKEATASISEGERIPVDVVETEGAVKPDILVDSESNGSGGSIKVTGSGTNEATTSIPDDGTIPVDVAEPEGAVKPDIPVDSESNESGGSMTVTGSGTKEATSISEGEMIPVDVAEPEGDAKPDIAVDSVSNESGGSKNATGSGTKEATSSIVEGETIPVDVVEPEGAVKPDIPVGGESNESGGSKKATGSAGKEATLIPECGDSDTTPQMSEGGETDEYDVPQTGDAPQSSMEGAEMDTVEDGVSPQTLDGVKIDAQTEGEKMDTVEDGVPPQSCESDVPQTVDRVTEVSNFATSDGKGVTTDMFNVYKANEDGSSVNNEDATAGGVADEPDASAEKGDSTPCVLQEETAKKEDVPLADKSDASDARGVTSCILEEETEKNVDVPLADATDASDERGVTYILMEETEKNEDILLANEFDEKEVAPRILEETKKKSPTAFGEGLEPDDGAVSACKDRHFDESEELKGGVADELKGGSTTNFDGESNKIGGSERKTQNPIKETETEFEEPTGIDELKNKLNVDLFGESNEIGGCSTAAEVAPIVERGNSGVSMNALQIAKEIGTDEDEFGYGTNSKIVSKELSDMDISDGKGTAPCAHREKAWNEDQAGLFETSEEREAEFDASVEKGTIPCIFEGMEQQEHMTDSKENIENASTEVGGTGGGEFAVSKEGEVKEDESGIQISWEAATPSKAQFTVSSHCYSETALKSTLSQRQERSHQKSDVNVESPETSFDNILFQRQASAFSSGDIVIQYESSSRLESDKQYQEPSQEENVNESLELGKSHPNRGDGSVTLHSLKEMDVSTDELEVPKSQEAASLPDATPLKATEEKIMDAQFTGDHCFSETALKSTLFEHQAFSSGKQVIQSESGLRLEIGNEELSQLEVDVNEESPELGQGNVDSGKRNLVSGNWTEVFSGTVSRGDMSMGGASTVSSHHEREREAMKTSEEESEVISKATPPRLGDSVPPVSERKDGQFSFDTSGGIQFLLKTPASTGGTTFKGSSKRTDEGAITITGDEREAIHEETPQQCLFKTPASTGGTTFKGSSKRTDEGVLTITGDEREAIHEETPQQFGHSTAQVSELSEEYHIRQLLMTPATVTAHRCGTTFKGSSTRADVGGLMLQNTTEQEGIVSKDSPRRSEVKTQRVTVGFSPNLADFFPEGFDSGDDSVDDMNPSKGVEQFHEFMELQVSDYKEEVQEEDRGDFIAPHGEDNTAMEDTVKFEGAPAAADLGTSLQLNVGDEPAEIMLPGDDLESGGFDDRQEETYLVPDKSASATSDKAMARQMGDEGNVESMAGDFSFMQDDFDYHLAEDDEASGVKAAGNDEDALTATLWEEKTVSQNIRSQLSEGTSPSSNRRREMEKSDGIKLQTIESSSPGAFLEMSGGVEPQTSASSSPGDFMRSANLNTSGVPSSKAQMGTASSALWRIDESADYGTGEGDSSEANELQESEMTSIAGVEINKEQALMEEEEKGAAGSEGDDVKVKVHQDLNASQGPIFNSDCLTRLKDASSTELDGREGGAEAPMTNNRSLGFLVSPIHKGGGERISARKLGSSVMKRGDHKKVGADMKENTPATVKKREAAGTPAAQKTAVKRRALEDLRTN